MTLPCKMAGVLAVLLVLNAAPPAKADDKDGPPQDTPAKLRQQVESLQRKLRALQQQRQDDRDYYAEQLSSMKSQLNRIEKQLSQLSDQTGSRRSLSFTPSTQTGRIRIVNELNVPATVTIDGRSYLVDAGGERILRDRPTGSIRYYVTADGFSVGPVNRSYVRADETLTVTVYDTRRRIIDE